MLTVNNYFRETIIFGNWQVKQRTFFGKKCSWLTVRSCDNISCQPLWNNDYIKIGNSSIYNIKLCQKGVRFVNDILETNGDFFFSLKHFQEKYNIQINFLFYRGLCDAIRQGFNNCTIF